MDTEQFSKLQIVFILQYFLHYEAINSLLLSFKNKSICFKRCIFLSSKISFCSFFSLYCFGWEIHILQSHRHMNSTCIQFPRAQVLFRVEFLIFFPVKLIFIPFKRSNCRKKEMSASSQGGVDFSKLFYLP